MFLFFYFYEDKVMGRHAWNKVDINGDRWKTEDSAMFFIYTPIITVSVARKKNRLKMFAILPPLPFWCRIFFYLNYTNHPSIYFYSITLVHHRSNSKARHSHVL